VSVLFLFINTKRPLFINMYQQMHYSINDAYFSFTRSYVLGP